MRQHETELGDVLTVRTTEQLKVMADPLRLRLLALLRERPRTVKELAETLAVPTTRLYYHVNQLEAHGFIRVAETRLVSGIVEKHYRASTSRVSVDRALLSAGASPGDPALELLLSSILDGTREGIVRSAQAGLIDPSRESPAEGGLLLGRRWLRLTPEQTGALYERLIDVVKDFEAKPEAAESRPYELLLGLYPTAQQETDRA